MGWRRFWSRKLIAQSNVKGRSFMLSFKVYQSDDGGRTCHMSLRAGDGEYSSSMRPDELGRLIEAAQEAMAKLSA